MEKILKFQKTKSLGMRKVSLKSNSGIHDTLIKRKKRKGLTTINVIWMSSRPE